MPVPQGATAAMPRAGEPPAPAPQRVTPTMIGSSPASGLKRRIEPTATGFDPSGKRALTTHGEFSRGADSRGGHSQGGAMMSHGGGGGGGATVMMLAPSPAGAASLPARATPGTLHCQLDGGEADPFAAAAAAAAAADGNDDAAPAGPVMLEARNAERHCDVVCSAAGTTRWTDRCGDSRATHIAGSSVFAAVFFENGCVQLYTPAGRRAMPPLVLPGRAAFVYAQGGQLVAVTGDCSLVVWELGTPGREAETARVSVAPLLTGPRAPPAPPMVGVRLAKCGSPVAQFADGHAYVFHQGLKCWARVADHSFPRSEFTTRLRLPAAAGGGGGGELHALQVAAARAAVGMGPSALLSGGAPAPRRETGRHLECLLSAAEMMGSQAEYRTWLRAYVRHLAAEGADAQAPLRELCHAMLGPLSARVERGVDGDWAASVAGLEKRVLLRETVLPALAANRACQRLVGEMDELLEVAEKRAGEKR